MSGLLDQLRQLSRSTAVWIALAAAIALTVIGIEAIAVTDAHNTVAFAPRQLRWLVIALCAMLCTMLPLPRAVGLASYTLFGICIALLVFVLIPGVPRWLVPPINGARSWINLGVMNFQPAEATKVTFILAMAWYLRFRDNYRTLRGLLVPFAFMIVPVALMLKQPDMGTAMLFAPALFAVLVAAGAKLRHLTSLIAIGILLVAVNVAWIYTMPESMQILKEHQRNRFVSMISLARGETQFTQTTAYQQHKAMTLVGAGQTTGFGANRAATIVRFNALPEDHNDMIFPVIVARWGLVGGVVTLGLYVLLVASFIAIAARTKDPFARLATVGFAGLLFAQAMINIAMTVGLLPITGITLPFVSYGGSSLVACFAMLGLVINFASRRPGLLTRPSFEFEHADALFQ